MWKIPTSSSIPKFRAIVIYVTGFVLLLKLLENYLNIFYKFKGAWKLLKNEKFKKTPWMFYLNTNWMWKNILETIKEKKI